MITALLIAAAAALLYADRLKAMWAKLDAKLPTLQAHHYLAIGLLIVAGLAYTTNTPDAQPTPSPGGPPGALSLDGLFTGPTAATDAAALAALCDELAAAVEFDAMCDKPRLSNGWQIADLRTAAREIRMAGQSIGARQPLVRDAVQRHLDHPDVLGKGGGPLSPRDRARWIAAFREIARAAESAIR